MLVVPTYHPAFLLRGKRLYDAVLLGDLQKAFDLAAGRRQVQQWRVKVAPTYREAVDFLKHALCAPEIATDTETTREDPFRSDMLCFSVATEERGAMVIPIFKSEAPTAPAKIGAQPAKPKRKKKRRLVRYWTPRQEARLQKLTRQLLERKRVVKVLQNAQFDTAVYKHQSYGTIRGRVLDTLYLQHTVDPELPMNLAFLISRYTYAEPHKDLVREGATADTKGSNKFVSMLLRGEDDKFWLYNGDDSACLFEIKNALAKKVEERKLWGVYDHDMKLADLARRMTERGVGFDKVKAREYRRMLTHHMRYRLDRMRAVIGDPDFRPFQGAKLRHAIFKQLGVPLEKGPDFVTSTGLQSTNQDVLTYYLLKGGLPETAAYFLDSLLRYRRAQKMRSTFIDAPLHLAFDGVIHPHWRASWAVTGRWACAKPNLTNIPKKEKRKTKQFKRLNLRELFRPRDGYVYVWGDVSQLELKMVAYLAQADELIARLADPNYDAHSYYTSRLFKIPIEQVTKETPARDLWKRFLYQFIYMGTPEQIYKKLRPDFPGLRVGECVVYHKRLKRELLAVVKWWESIERDLNKQFEESDEWPIVKDCLLGRERKFAGSFEDVANEAVNWPVQTGGASLVGKAQLLLEDALHGFDAHQVIQVHDEVVVECREKDVHEIGARMQDCFRQISKPFAPLVFDLELEWSPYRWTDVVEKSKDGTKWTPVDRDAH